MTTCRIFHDATEIEDCVRATIFGALWQGGWDPVDAIEEAKLKMVEAKDRHFQAYS